MKKSDTRIYKNKENIEPHKVCEFWESRAKNTFSNKGVLLGEGLGKNLEILEILKKSIY